MWNPYTNQDIYFLYRESPNDSGTWNAIRWSAERSALTAEPGDRVILVERWRSRIPAWMPERAFDRYAAGPRP